MIDPELEIKAYVPPDMEQMSNEDLCVLAQAGNVDAANVLVWRNGGFISNKSYSVFEELFSEESVYSVTWEDLLQEARLAFWKAIFRFEPARKMKLTTFAGECIRNALHDYWDHFCVENKMERKLWRVEGTADEDEPELSFDDSQDFEAETPGETFDPFYSEDLLDEYHRRPEPILLEKETIEEISRAVSSLPPREQKYLCYRFGYPLEVERSLKDTAEHFSLRASRADKIERKALDAVRKGLRW